MHRYQDVLFASGGFRAGSEPFIERLARLDGDSDLQDLATLLSGFGTENGPGDLDGDGDTDLEDLAVLLADFGSICP